MVYYFIILFVVLVANIYCIILWLNNKVGVLRLVMTTLLCIGVFRYFILFLFALSESPEYLFIPRYLALVSYITLPIVSFTCLKLIKNSVLVLYDKIFLGLLGSGALYIIYMAPEGITSIDIGYSILFRDGWQFIILIFQGLFAALMIYLSLVYFMKEKIAKIKLTYFIFFTGYCVSIAEALISTFSNKLLPENIIAEGLIFLAIITSLRTRKE